MLTDPMQTKDGPLVTIIIEFSPHHGVAVFPIGQTKDCGTCCDTIRLKTDSPKGKRYAY